MKALKVFRIFKAFRYSKNVNIIVNVFKAQRDSLMVVCGIAIVALPAGIIMAGYQEELYQIHKEEEEEENKDT